VKPLHERLSDDFQARAWKPRPSDGKTRSRWLAIGDPQTTSKRFLAVLEGHGLLDANGSLREEIGLVSIGDHFDFSSHDGKSLADTGRDGADILRWLAEHPPDQVVILLGNHDTARVMELAFESDESFTAARELALECKAEVPPGDKTREFVKRYPRIPTPEVAYRDNSTFAVYQRKLVQQLLLAGRVRLACLGHHDGKPVLLTHASITNEQITQLGVEPDAAAIVEALDAHLQGAVARVRGAWERDELAALDLEPLHFAGREGREGGGLLYHRASQNVDPTGEDAPIARRKFHPRHLPRGLVQIQGHCGHHKCREELAEWLGPAAKERERGGLRTLSAGETSIVYDQGIAPARDEHATVYFIDIEMNQPTVTDLPLFELESVVATR
jgi:hypothetical protein